MARNSTIGNTALPNARARMTGRRPQRSASMPVSGVTAITATAAQVASPRARPSGTWATAAR